MNQEIKTEWVADLRSGEYEQGNSYLTTVTTDDDGTEHQKHCCLAVLCLQAVRKGIIPPPVKREGDEGTEQPATMVYAGDRYWLPRSVREWAGLQSENPALTPDGIAPENTTTALAPHNDGGTEFTPDGGYVQVTKKTFAEIADLIEEHM